jgi:hypothetical protein
MTTPGRAQLYLRQAWAEGPAATWARWWDRRQEARRAARFRSLPLTAAAQAMQAHGQHPRLLNILGSPPWLRLGGVQMQLRSRWAQERRPRALLYPLPHAWQLELEAGALAFTTTFPRTPQTVGTARDPGLERALAEIASALELRAGHVENLAGLPIRSLASEAVPHFEWAVSLHDFAAFCPRPTLIEQPHGRFCDYSRVAARCAACLDHDQHAGTDVLRWRDEATQFLTRARALVFPSEFLRARLSALLPGLDARCQHVFAPSLDGLPAWQPAVPGTSVGRGLRHAAFVGAARADKGAQVFTEVVRAARGSALRFSAYGGGSPEALASWRRAGVRVRGFHEPGSLAAVLRRERVDLALLLSIWPETYALTLDECVAAGAWTLAFDLGALGERVRAWRCGQVVPLASGAAGVNAALAALRTGGVPPVPTHLGERLPRAAAAAAAHLALYRALGWLDATASG